MTDKVMQEYLIPCTWTMYGISKVMATSLEEAIALADEAPLPDRSEYVDDSYVLDIGTLAVLADEREEFSDVLTPEEKEWIRKENR